MTGGGGGGGGGDFMSEAGLGGGCRSKRGRDRETHIK